MSASKWSLRYLFHKFREVTQKRTRSQRRDDKRPRHLEKNSIIAGPTSSKDKNPTNSKVEICQGQEKTALKGSNHNYESEKNSTMAGITSSKDKDVTVPEIDICQLQEKTAVEDSNRNIESNCHIDVLEGNDTTESVVQEPFKSMPYLMYSIMQSRRNIMASHKKPSWRYSIISTGSDDTTRSDWPEVSALFIINRISAEDWSALKVLITTEQSESTLAVSTFYYADILDTLVNARAIDTKVFNDQEDLIATVNVLRLGPRADLQKLNSSLHLASRRAVPAAIQLFLELGSDVNSILDDYPAMCQVILHKSPLYEESMIECLLLMTNYVGANVDTCGKNGISPLRCAINSELHDVIDILLNHGASVHMDDLRSCVRWSRVSIATVEDILNHYLSIYKANNLGDMTAILARCMDEKQAKSLMRLLQTHADQYEQRDRESELATGVR